MTEYFEMIPFYLNNTLPPEERAAFEAALQEDEALGREVAAWREVAQAVVDEVMPQMRGLPPLRPDIRAEITESAARRRAASAAAQRGMIPMPQGTSHTLPSRRGAATRRSVPLRIPLTLAAAVGVMLTVGILLFAVNRSGPDDGTQIALLGTESATVTDQFSGVGPEGIGGGADSPTPRMTSVLPPTATLPAPPVDAAAAMMAPVDEQGVGGGNTDTGPVQIIPTNTIVPPEGTLQPAAAMNGPTNPTGNCFVVNETPNALNIYRFADSSSEVVGVLTTGERLDTWVHTGKAVSEPFYQVFMPDGDPRLGWVDAVATTLYGPDGTQNCSQLLLPTPTNSAPLATITVVPVMSPTPAQCRLLAAGPRLTVYVIPEADAPVLRTFGGTEALVANARYTTDWFRVIVPSVGFGWARTTDVVTSGFCAFPPQPSYVQPTEMFESVSMSATPTADSE